MKREYVSLLLLLIIIIFSCGINDPMEEIPKKDPPLVDTSQMVIDTTNHDLGFANCIEETFCNCYLRDLLQFDKVLYPWDSFYLRGDPILDDYIQTIMANRIVNQEKNGYYLDDTYYVNATINGRYWEADYIEYSSMQTPFIAAFSLNEYNAKKFEINLGEINYENKSVIFSPRFIYEDRHILGPQYVICDQAIDGTKNFFEIDTINYQESFMGGRFEYTVSHLVEDLPWFEFEGAHEPAVLEVRDGKFKVKFEQ